MQVSDLKLKFFSCIADILQIIFYPILIIQEYNIRKNVKQLSEAVGSRAGRIGNGRKLNILVLGDSSACGVGVRHMRDSLGGQIIDELKTSFDCRWKIVAMSGIDTTDLLELIKNNQKEKFDIAILAIGMNDITRGKSAIKWKRQILYLAGILYEKYRVSVIIFSGIPPVRKLSQVPQPLKLVLSFKAFIFDSYLRQLCLQSNLGLFVKNDFPVNKTTMAEDGFHPNEIYYKRWARSIVKEIFRQDSR